MKPAPLRPTANRDLVESARCYAEHRGTALAERFLDEARSVLQTAGRTPGIGSLRLGELAAVPGLRSWALRSFPARRLYLGREEALDAIRRLGDDSSIILEAPIPATALALRRGRYRAQTTCEGGWMTNVTIFESPQ